MLHPRNGFKIRRRKVIHSLPALRFRGTLRSAMNNFGNGIRAGVRASVNTNLPGNRLYSMIYQIAGWLLFA